METQMKKTVAPIITPVELEEIISALYQMVYEGGYTVNLTREQVLSLCERLQKEPIKQPK